VSPDGSDAIAGAGPMGVSLRIETKQLQQGQGCAGKFVQKAYELAQIADVIILFVKHECVMRPRSLWTAVDFAGKTKTLWITLVDEAG
jgi:hypothetical protein